MGPSDEVRRIAAEGWAFRWRVEREAELRFARLAKRLAADGAPEAVVALAQKASADEAVHTRLCAELAARFGLPVDGSAPVEVPEVAPAALKPHEALTYEVVAACCVTETESTGVLTTLLGADPEPEVREVLHVIARDEVDHARLGWAHLASVQTSLDLAFLGRWVPVILSGTVSDTLFQPAKSEALESPGLLRFGVLPHGQKRQVFARMLREVVFPGLSHFGVDVAPAQTWLQARAPI